MPQTTDDFIRFRCPCGVKLKIPAAAAGRRIRCPKCSKTFLAATDQPAPATAAAAPASARAAAAPPKPAASEDNLLSDLLAAESSSEALQAPPSADKAAKCPNCGSAMAASANTCGVCGYTKVVAPKAAAGPTKSAKVAKVASSLALGTGRFMIGTVLSFIGAVIGASIWFGVALATDRSRGILMLLVGLFAGLGMRFGYRNENLRAGLMAAAMTLVGAFAGQIAVFFVVVAVTFGGALGDTEFQRDMVTDEITNKILDDREVYTAADREAQWDGAHAEAAQRVSNMSDEEVARMFEEQLNWDELFDIDTNASAIAYHRAERRIEKEGLDDDDRRNELYLEEELAKAKKLSPAETKAAMDEIEAWDKGGKWEDAEYVRNFLIDSITQDLLESSGAFEDYENWDQHWKTQREAATAQVDAMSESERVERAKQIDHDEEERIKKIVADLEDSSSNGLGAGGVAGGASVALFFIMMFGIFNCIFLILAMGVAFKVAGGFE